MLWKNIYRIGAFVKIQVVIIMIISIRKQTAREIDWNALDRCWCERYEEEYGHYFSDRSYFDSTIRAPVVAAIAATIF